MHFSIQNILMTAFCVFMIHFLFKFCLCIVFLPEMCGFKSKGHSVGSQTSGSGQTQSGYFTSIHVYVIYWLLGRKVKKIVKASDVYEWLLFLSHTWSPPIIASSNYIHVYTCTCMVKCVDSICKKEIFMVKKSWLNKMHIYM